MVEIKAGPELDRAVAEAIGYKPHDFGYNPGERDFPCAEYFRGHDSGIVNGKVWIWDDHKHFVPFRPSADMNDAFAAAEKVGLFRGARGQFHLKPGGGRSFVMREDLCDERLDTLYAYGDTPALAICAAVLKLTQSGQQ